MDSLLQYADHLNLGAAIVVLLGGLVIYFLASPQVFDRHRYMKTAFEYWLLQWCAFVLIYIYAVSPGSSRLLLLASADLQSVLALGFFAAMFRGSDYHFKDTGPSLVIFFTVLTLWNVGVGGRALNSVYGSTLRVVWVLPSEVASASTLVLIAYVFLRRYGYPAISFVFVLAAYVLLQRPAYTGFFVSPPDKPVWLLLLAFGKLFYGLLLYTMFFLTAKQYGHIGAPTFGVARPSLQRIVRWSVAIITGVVTHFVTLAAAEQLHRCFL
jgi:hypothetical protein